MTREKEILNAATEARMASAETLTTRGTHHSIDDIPFIDEMITYDEVAENAFIKGAEWADSHPVNVWHDASEIPRMNHKNIIYQTNYCSLFNVHIAFVPTCLRSGKITSYSWNEFVKDVNMRRWAYTDDLLPKGGEK